MADWQTEKNDRLTDSQSDRLTDLQTNRLTDWQTYSVTDWQIVSLTGRQTKCESYMHWRLANNYDDKYMKDDDAVEQTHRLVITWQSDRRRRLLVIARPTFDIWAAWVLTMNGFWPPPPAHWILPGNVEDWYTVKQAREFRRDRVQSHILYDEGLPHRLNM